MGKKKLEKKAREEKNGVNFLKVNQKILKDFGRISPALPHPPPPFFCPAHLSIQHVVNANYSRPFQSLLIGRHHYDCRCY